MLGCFTIIVLQLYCYYKFFVALPHGAVGWSAVCDADHTQFLTLPQYILTSCLILIKLILNKW